MEPEDERRADLGRLYDRLAPSLYRYAVMILASPPEAEDVVHRVFLRLLARGLDGVETCEGYARQAVRNECFSQLRRRRRAFDGDPGALLEAAPGIPDQPDDRLALERALRDLPADQREVVHLKVFEGWTFPEIAALSGESANTIASRYRYGLSKLRASLTP